MSCPSTVQARIMAASDLATSPVIKTKLWKECVASRSRNRSISSVATTCSLSSSSRSASITIPELKSESKIDQDVYLQLCGDCNYNAMVFRWLFSLKHRPILSPVLSPVSCNNEGGHSDAESNYQEDTDDDEFYSYSDSSEDEELCGERMIFEME